MSTDIDAEFLSLTLPEVTVFVRRGPDRRTSLTAIERERRQEIRRITDRQYDEWKANREQ